MATDKTTSACHDVAVSIICVNQCRSVAKAVRPFGSTASNRDGQACPERSRRDRQDGQDTAERHGATDSHRWPRIRRRIPADTCRAVAVSVICVNQCRSVAKAVRPFGFGGTSHRRTTAPPALPPSSALRLPVEPFASIVAADYSAMCAVVVTPLSSAVIPGRRTAAAYIRVRNCRCPARRQRKGAAWGRPLKLQELPLRLLAPCGSPDTSDVT